MFLRILALIFGLYLLSLITPLSIDRILHGLMVIALLVIVVEVIK